MTILAAIAGHYPNSFDAVADITLPRLSRPNRSCRRTSSNVGLTCGERFFRAEDALPL